MGKIAQSTKQLDDAKMYILKVASGLLNNTMEQCSKELDTILQDAIIEKKRKDLELQQDAAIAMIKKETHKRKWTEK